MPDGEEISEPTNWNPILWIEPTPIVPNGRGTGWFENKPKEPLDKQRKLTINFPK